MLFIFRVDIGTMINLDMNLALETVSHLKAAVASYCNIPIDKQVLLISGGESLEAHERVCKYTAGSSDSNPIFLFSVSTLEGSHPPIFTEVVHERDLQPEVESSLNLPDTHNTVAVRASLAQEYVKVSREQFRLCESEIHDQHLQHQGWAAALANLEDSVLALEKRKSSFEDAYSLYLHKREHFRKVIETFDEDIHTLSKIPVLPALLPENSNGRPAEGRPEAEKTTSLLDWINQAGNSSLEQVADSCYRSLEQLDDVFLDKIKTTISNCVEGANNHQMKEIRGLGDRLSGLEQLLLDANKKVTEQKDLAAAFLQNQARANGLKDTSILPDLCASHKQQLLVMMRNHQHIVSIRRRCIKAKEELSLNLYTRLKWVMFIQRQMAEVGQQLVLYFEELKRLSRRLEVMEQLHLAPSIYLAAVVEVVRRKSFSEHYLRKSSLLAANFSAIYSEELKTRQSFQEKLSKHFLATMFKGMEDLPPPFATKEPDPFDQNLPSLSLSDLESMRAKLPELAESLSVPDRKTLSSLLTKSLSQNLTKEEDDALHSLHNLTSRISIEGNGLGSVSMMNRICYDAATRKKSRLVALAASRERDLSSETDSEHEEKKSKVKAKIPRKMTRSLPSKGEAMTLLVEQLRDVSSSSVDPSSSTGNTNSSAAPSSDGSLLKHNWQSQTQADEKTKELERLQTQLSIAGEDRERLDGRAASILEVSTAGLASIRDELQLIKSQVEYERKDVIQVLADLAEKLVSDLNRFEAAQGGEKELEERELADTRERLELERRNLENSRREIQVLRSELDETKSALESLARERVEREQVLEDQEQSNLRKIGELQNLSEEKLSELKQKLELEHELEFDSLKQQLGTAGKSKLCEVEKDLAGLRFQLQEKCELCEELETKIQLIDITNDERIKEEKDRIVSILEAGFSERQRVAHSQLEKNLTTTYEKRLQDTKEKDNEDMCTRLDELRQKMIETSQINLERVLEKKEREWREVSRKREDELKIAFEKEKKLLEMEKDQELVESTDKVRKKSKMELDNLRSRFKIMQSTATLDRSPSMSESELSFEDARLSAVSNSRNRCYSTGEFFKSRGSDHSEAAEAKTEDCQARVSGEKERESLRREVENCRQELRDKELQFAQEKAALENSIEEIRRSEKLRNSAEKQQIFNEAIKKAVEDKDKKIGELQAQLVIFKDRQQATDLEFQLSDVSRRNAQLESELREAQQKLSNNMIASFAVETEESLRQLQEENKQLRDQLSRSMTSLISTGKVSVTSADKGDIVLVVWSDPLNNYSIYHEGSILHLLHTDSIEQLGLTPERGTPRTRHITAEVVDKEYCQARKPENRYKVPQGTKFYRVKCQTLKN